MHYTQTPWGKFFKGTQNEIFEELALSIEKTALNANEKPVIGMSGGSTPKAFYEWVVAMRRLKKPEDFIWTTSDERCVPLDHPDSNCGLLKNTFLDPLNINKSNLFSWPTENNPLEAAHLFEQNWQINFGAKGFDVCVLGIGEDGHTASLFPYCELIGQTTDRLFAAVNWPEKGWRLTSTEHMFQLSSKIIVLAVGSSKSKILKTVLEGPIDVMQYPVQVLKKYSEKVDWLFGAGAY